MTAVDYLDLEFDLKRKIFSPYKKPNSDPLYVHKDSNHPPSVLQQIPNGIARRLSDTSANKEIFDKAAPEYEQALQNSGFKVKLEYLPERVRRKNRSRKIIWYNPPYAANVKTNLGKEFLRLLKNHFHKQHSFHKIFNKNTVKLSYSCTKNVASIISGHNKRILRQATGERDEEQRMCSCRNKESCPLGNECLSKSIIYEATVTSKPEDVEKRYVGLCSTSFKERLALHKQHMNNKAHRTKCELANHVWELKDAGKEFKLEWKILKKVRGRLVGGACRLCTTEQLYIVEHEDRNNLLNSKCVEKCRHGDKYSLKSVINTRRQMRGAVD